MISDSGLLFGATLLIVFWWNVPVKKLLHACELCVSLLLQDFNIVIIKTVMCNGDVDY